MRVSCLWRGAWPDGDGSRSRLLSRVSVATTGLDHHVAVFSQYDVVAAVIVEHGGGAQFGGCTARLGDDIWFHQVYLAGREAMQTRA